MIHRAKLVLLWLLSAAIGGAVGSVITNLLFLRGK
jgi:hypothetical protein